MMQYIDEVALNRIKSFTEFITVKLEKPLLFSMTHEIMHVVAFLLNVCDEC